jgi:hypothetical protein
MNCLQYKIPFNFFHFGVRGAESVVFILEIF